MHDLSLLKLLLLDDNYRRYRNYVDDDYFSEPVLPILAVVDKWKQEHIGDLTVDDLTNLLFAEQPMEYKDDGILDTLRNTNTTETALEAVQALIMSKGMKDLALYSFEASRGRRSLSEVLALVEKIRETSERKHSEQSFEFVSDDLETLLADTVNEPGLRWRLEALNKSLGPLRKGDFGFVFARPEAGKTTFLSSEITYMAANLREDEGPVIWINNEERGEKVKLRAYQGALGCNLRRLVNQPRSCKQEYQDLLKGKLLLYDNAKIDYRTIEAMMRSLSPSLVVFDQIDKITGFKNDRPDLQLGELYIWARGLAKDYCPIIGVTQADASGEGQRYLTMANVANAKTAKQAEADWILGIGHSADPDFEGVRFLNISKNKLVGDNNTDDSKRHFRGEVLFKPDIARYEDI